MKKWVLMILGLLMMLVLAVPAMAQTGEPDAAQNAGTVSAPYTVEFTYDGNQYVMPGDSSVRLSAVLDEVSLTGEAEAVAVSDESLFSASNATGEWIVTAHQAFSTTEWMKVTIGGVAYEITVTDGIVLSGNGTVETPYLIGTSEQWQFFSQLINTENATYGDKYYKLTADISIGANNTFIVVGQASDRAFRGHFDGGGHTLTFNYSGMVGGAAPFQYVNGATIENLKVTGTISDGNLYTAGIAGYVTGNTTISNCTSSVTISASHSGSGHFGGLVGSVESLVTLNINNCLFNGSMTGSAELDCGGFVGYNLGTVNITDCLCAPGSIGVGMYSFVLNRAGGSSTLTRAYSIYYNSTKKSQNQGTRVYSSAPAGQLTQKITAADNNSYWMEGAAAITGVSDGYAWTGAAITPPSFGVTFNGTPLTNGTDYTAAWTNGASVTVNSFDGLGTYTLIVTGRGIYAGSVTRTVKVESGDGSQEYPYLIGSEADWNSFAAAVNSGNAYSGKYVMLTGDISVSAMVGDGSNSSKVFRGTFLGNSHTLTVNLIGNYYAAPFGRVDGATIQDLTVAGTVHETSSYGGSLIGRSYGATTVSNCHSTATVTFTGYDSGGLVGRNIGTLSINGCSFKGSMSGTAGKGSGFVGYNESGCSVSITNCLFAPTSAAGGYITFVRGDGWSLTSGL